MENKQKKEDFSYKIIIITVAIIIFLDQISKILVIDKTQNASIPVIGNILKITYVENTGGAFGVGSGNVITFIITNLIIITLILKFMTAQKERMNKITQTSLILILAGGISNLLDRILRGFVVDFIDLNGIFKFPMFNIADMAIVMGWIILIIVTIRYGTKNETKEQEKKEK